MLERCYLHDYDLPKLSRSVAAEVRYENVTLYNDWGQPVGVGRHYYRDCLSGCCWYVGDYCCPVTSYDLVTRAVAVIVTLLLITAVIVMFLCGGAVMSRRGGQRLPSWLPQRPRRQPPPCLFSDRPDADAAAAAPDAALAGGTDDTTPGGRERLCLQRQLFRQQLSQQRFVRRLRAAAGLVLPPPYKPREADEVCHLSPPRTPPAGLVAAAREREEGVAKPPPAYEYRNPAAPRPIVHLLQTLPPPPLYSEIGCPPDDANRGGGGGATLPEPPPSYDQCACQPLQFVPAASFSSPSSSSLSSCPQPQTDGACR